MGMGWSLVYTANGITYTTYSGSNGGNPLSYYGPIGSGAAHIASINNAINTQNYSKYIANQLFRIRNLEHNLLTDEYTQVPAPGFEDYFNLPEKISFEAFCENGAHYADMNGGNYNNLINSPFDPSGIAKLTYHFFASGAVKMEGYSTLNVHEGRSPFEVVKNAKSRKLESIGFNSRFGNITMGLDGSITYGNSILSIGADDYGSWILDLSFPTGSKSRLGTTFYYNPQIGINNVKVVLNYINSSLPFSWGIYPVPIYAY